MTEGELLIMLRWKKNILMLIAGVMITAAAAGCGTYAAETETGQESNSAATAETGTGLVHISGVDGSGSRAPIPPAYLAVSAWYSPSTGHSLAGAYTARIAYLPGGTGMWLSSSPFHSTAKRFVPDVTVNISPPTKVDTSCFGSSARAAATVTWYLPGDFGSSIPTLTPAEAAATASPADSMTTVRIDMYPPRLVFFRNLRASAVSER